MAPAPEPRTLAGLAFLLQPIARRGHQLAAISLFLGVAAIQELLYDDDTLGAVIGAAIAVLALVGARKARIPSWPELAALSLNVAVLAAGLVAGPSRNGPKAADNEKEAYRDMLNFRRAEDAYALVNGTLHGDAECLLDPAASGCAREGRDSVPFLGPLLGEQHGYLRTFHPGRRPGSAGSPRPAGSARSLETWAWTATPLKVGTTGRRGFCLDSATRMCFTPNGSEPPLGGDGLCVATEGPEVPQRNLMERILYRMSGRGPDTRCHALTLY